MTPEENDLLCRVEGDAPMGQIMRRHWIAACLSEEVAEPDGTPVRVKLLGESLVVFRDSKGRLGVLDEYCSHRRASLLYARNEECGLRCLYHGWKFDVEGNVVEMASEPAESNIPQRVKHKAYPAREAGGFVWCYMGPADEMPAFEPPAFAPTPDARVSATKVRVRCNWAQILEGQIDSAHSSSLHSSDMVPAQVEGAKATDTNWLRPSTDKAPRFQIERTSYGFRYAAIRRPIQNEATHDYIRTTVYIAPFTALIPPNNVHNVATLLTPEDDHTTIFYFIAWNGADKPGIDAEAWRKFNVLEWGVDVDANFDGIRTRANNYLQDRAAMKDGNFTGIAGIPNQDIAMWEGMGPISDRSQRARRRVRRGGRGVPPPDGGSRARRAERRPGDRHHEPARAACDDKLLRRCSTQVRQLAYARRRERAAARPRGLRRRQNKSQSLGGRTMKARTIACALAFALLGSAASAQDTIKLAIGQRGNWDTSVSEVGQRAGIFKKHGLTLDIVYTQGAGETQQAVISGSVDIGVAAGVMGVLSAYSKGAPVRVIGGRDDRRGRSLLVREGRFADQDAEGHRRQDARLFDQRLLDARRRDGVHEAV